MATKEKFEHGNKDGHENRWQPRKNLGMEIKTGMKTDGN
jgi:hypothetical protein